MATSTVPPPAHASQKSPDLEISHVPAVVRGADHGGALVTVVTALPGLRPTTRAWERAYRLSVGYTHHPIGLCRNVSDRSFGQSSTAQSGTLAASPLEA